MVPAGAPIFATTGEASLFSVSSMDSRSLALYSPRIPSEIYFGQFVEPVGPVPICQAQGRGLIRSTHRRSAIPLTLAVVLNFVVGVLALIRKIPSTKAKMISLGGTFLLALALGVWILEEASRGEDSEAAQDSEAEDAERPGSRWESKWLWAYAMLLGGIFLV